MDDVRRARRGLLVFFAVLIPLTALFEGLIIRRIKFGPPGTNVFLLMWSPAVASFAARRFGREGLADLSLRPGGARGARALLYAILFPVGVGAIAYGLAWSTGLAGFAPPDEDPVIWAPPWLAPLPGSPAVRFVQLLLHHLTIGALFGSLWAAGEEIGWRGYLAPRMVEAKIRGALPLSGLVWAMWHWPLILRFHPAGVPRPLALALFTALLIPLGCGMARLRFETGSVLAPIVLHAVWNDVIGVAFGGSTPNEGIWLGEQGILVLGASVILLAPLLRSRFPARRAPDALPHAELGAFS